MEYMRYLHEHYELLMYLRYHPRWYKILYYEPSYFNVFLKEAKESLHIRGIDKLENIKNKINLARSLAELFKSWK